MSAPSILIVDDSSGDRVLYRRMLEDAYGSEFVLLEAATGGEGVELCRGAAPSCILLDFHLPDMTGHEFLERIADEGGNPLAPVVMLTGQGSESIAVRAMQRGAQDYLVKSALDADSLARSIQNARTKFELERALERQREEFRVFAHTAAHDLKAPLRKLEAHTAMLQDLAAGELGDDCQELLGAIGRSTTQMGALVKDLLDYARSAGAPLRTEPVELSTVVEQALERLEDVIHERGAEVLVGELPRVEGDRTGLVLLFQNILHNAVKFNRSAPPVVALAAREQGDIVEVTVEDNGIGIAPEDVEGVFEAFSRGHARDEFEGTGLGLATCARVVERQNGSITCRSELGKGTVFTLRLPAAGSRAVAEFRPV